MPFVKPLPDEPLDADQLALHEILKNAKAGEFAPVPADLLARIEAKVIARSTEALLEIRQRERRLSWLHSSAACDVDGYEWGIFRVKWGVAGEPHTVLQTLSDFSDLDAAIDDSEARVEPIAGPSSEPLSQNKPAAQANSAQASGGEASKTALPEQPEDYWIRQFTAARLAELGLRREVDALRNVGGQFANIAFNWSQDQGHTLTERDCATLKRLQREWDAACEARVEPVGPCSSEPLSQNKPAASSESSVSVPKEQQAVEILRELMQCAHSDPYAKKPWAPGQLGRFLTVNMPGALWDRARALTAGERL